jgi:hypothetical protein
VASGASVTAGETGRLALLIPECGKRVQQVIAAMATRGFDVYVGQTMRSQEQQAEAQARGTTSVNQSRSWHQLGRAADLRKRNSDGTVDESTHDEPFFRALFDEATKVGLRSLAFREDGSRLLIHTTHGDVWDAGHVEYRGPYDTLAEAFAAEGQKVA